MPSERIVEPRIMVVPMGIPAPMIKIFYRDVPD